MDFLRQLKFNRLLIVSLIIAAMVVGSSCTQQQQQEVEKIDEPTIEVVTENGETKSLNMEEYVAGVVAGEMKPNWSQNAYGAQAIIARTFALKLLKDEGTNQISGEHEKAQAYRPQNITDEIRQAVEKTRGEVVTHKGEYIKGWFHSSAAGQTTTAKVGLAYDKPEPEYITSVESPDQHAPEDVKSWIVTLPQSAILNVLKEIKGVQASKVENITIDDKDETGRAIGLTINYGNGSETIKAAKFRTSIGPDELKSTLIESIEETDNGFIFKGSGYGHGVGMSQWGAYALAKEGQSPEDIIKHYFTNIEIIKKWN
ncbi:SpoIID/LytB domain-containing protein [Acetohalobium arabaticum]|uniref:SpoIID/LytB domain protein n=1 Tax=Acetohalobium arabaticum (strain ATCC 49924 / DSM 5501 / Z-7288) TaxID=574087 RepID=D9QSW0_ACEAZ|nr:SpoIID/LytB domain-containing protein [Acetohalobium arabaticum]ADL11648.1 SpoIID/LytB domain protein [Acetohalobium arabaticum DSM 5501]